MLFTIDKKTGFQTSESPLFIYDERGIIFYRRFKQGVKRFNLPIGTYSTLNNLVVLPTPVKYLVTPLPTSQKEIRMDKLQINLIPDYEQKANINVGDGIININSGFFRLPKPIARKVFFHEIGHHLYYSEHLCDKFADLCMLKMGFNPSQLIAGTLCSLDKSKRNYKRIKYNFENGLRTKQA